MKKIVKIHLYHSMTVKEKFPIVKVSTKKDNYLYIQEWKTWVKMNIKILSNAAKPNFLVKDSNLLQPGYSYREKVQNCRIERH